jgi:hypothetical protein
MIEGRCAVDPELCKGCASPYAFETALRLLEIEEEIVGARMTRSTSQGVSTHNRGSCQGSCGCRAAVHIWAEALYSAYG